MTPVGADVPTNPLYVETYMGSANVEMRPLQVNPVDCRSCAKPRNPYCHSDNSNSEVTIVTIMWIFYQSRASEPELRRTTCCPGIRWPLKWTAGQPYARRPPVPANWQTIPRRALHICSSPAPPATPPRPIWRTPRAPWTSAPKEDNGEECGRRPP